VAQLYPLALGSLFVASYDLQDYSGSIRTRLHAVFPDNLTDLKLKLRRSHYIPLLTALLLLRVCLLWQSHDGYQPLCSNKCLLIRAVAYLPLLWDFSSVTLQYFQFTVDFEGPFCNQNKLVLVEIVLYYTFKKCPKFFFCFTSDVSNIWYPLHGFSFCLCVFL
jgi:hypothetical protein